MLDLEDDSAIGSKNMADKFTFAQFKAQYPDDDACLAAIL